MATLLVVTGIEVASAQSNGVHPELVKYVDFLEGQDTPAKEYIFGLFETYDLVILCEADHRERTQYEFIYDILSDARFDGGLLFTEVGSTGLTEDFNRFSQGPDVTDEELNNILVGFHRRLTWAPWPNTVSGYDLMAELYKINRTQRVTWYPSDVHYDWVGTNRTHEEFLKFYREQALNRDSLMAKHIINVYESLSTGSQSPKALVIMNYRHAYGNDFMKNSESKPNNAGRFLFEHYPGRIANVYIHNFANQSAEDIIETLTNDGKWDAAFAITGKRN